MRAEIRVGWLVLGIVLVLGGAGIVVVAVQAFSRVPDAELGDTRDLALGLMASLLALVCVAAGIGFMVSSRPRPPEHEAGDELE